MKRFRCSRLWVTLLVCFVSGTGCENKAAQVAKPNKPASPTDPLAKTEIVPPSEPSPAVDPTQAVLVASPPELPAGATLLDPDMVWEMRKPNSFAISPDEQWIAYISRGALWLCSVTAGPPTKLADLPNTVTELRSTMKNYRKWRGDFNKLASEMNSSQFDSRRRKCLALVRHVKWSPSQDGVFYVVSCSKKSMPYATEYRVRHVTTDGATTKVATLVRDTYDKPNYFWRFDLSHDRSLVVASGYKPLIWDAKTDKPVATCFDYLLPSTTSGRFLGIEIDSRQLVITDKSLKIEKRIDVTFNPRKLCKMFWSPDERYAICASRLDHPARDKWSGFRLNLETGEQRPLRDGRFSTRNSREDYVADQFVFTSNGEEVVRASCRGKGFFDGINNCLETIPDGKEPLITLSRFQKRPWPRKKYRSKKPYPPIRIDKDGSLFAVALPREGEKLGYRYWLLDREGNKWSCGPDDSTLYVSPFHVIALADKGQQVIACNEVQLFSIPVATLQNAKRAKDE